MSVIKHQSRGELAKYLTEVLGLSYKAPEDNLVEFFRAAGTTGALSDMEFEWLGDQGRTELSTVDRWGVYLTDKGYTGSLSDKFYQSILAGDLLGALEEWILASGIWVDDPNIWIDSALWIDDSSGAWILSTGSWVDAGVWVDAALWIDT
jgi:hypothetical protein